MSVEELQLGYQIITCEKCDKHKELYSCYECGALFCEDCLQAGYAMCENCEIPIFCEEEHDFKGWMCEDCLDSY